MNILESHLKFAHDPYYGFLTFCPTNIGTTLRASVHLKFNNLKQSEVPNHLLFNNKNIIINFNLLDVNLANLHFFRHFNLFTSLIKP